MKNSILFSVCQILLLLLSCFLTANIFAQEKTSVGQEQTLAEGARTAALSADLNPHVAVIRMDMMILPGASRYLSYSIKEASEKGAKVLVIELDTPGGILDVSQEMTQLIFESPIPVIVYVSPQGAMAASAGVFITMAAHMAAMAPGTSIGAAHPVQGDGKDIQGDMRLKAENMTIAMVKSIAEQRGRNVSWAEQSVRSSSSLTEQEALKENVINVVANDIQSLLTAIAGRKTKIAKDEFVFGDYSTLPVLRYEMRYQDIFLNILSNPNVAALLWLAATTGLSVELYNPGLILPGVVGIICLILALVVSQIIPISSGSLALIILGAILISIELFTGSLVLGLGGVISMIIGLMYLIDGSKAPGLAVAAEFIVPVASVVSAFLLFVAKNAYDVFRGKKSKTRINTGAEGMFLKQGEVVREVSEIGGKVFIGGEYWNAVTKDGSIALGERIVVEKVLGGLVLEVKRL